MARSLGTLTVDLLLKAGAFESDAGRAARIADKEAKSIARSFDAAGKAIGLALAAGVATATVAISGAINRMDDMSKAAQRANMPTEEFSKLAHAASLADVSMEDVTKAMGKLAKAQGDAALGLKTQKDAFASLGIAYKNSDGSLRSTTEVFTDFADKFQKFKGSPEVMALGMQVFGRSFQTLIPLLKDGSAGLRAAFEDAEKLGLVIGTKAGQQAEQFNDNLSRMKSLAGGVALSFASELLPTLVRFTDNVVDMVKAAGGAEAVMKKLSGYFDTFVTVVKVAAVYIGSTYAASLALATTRMVAMIVSTGSLSAATLGLTGVMTGLRIAAAFLFGPVGLIAAGATVLYMLATRQSEAEKAADLHKEALDRLKGAAHGSTEELARLAEQTKRNALVDLGVARAMLEVEQSKAKAALAGATSNGGSSEASRALQFGADAKVNFANQAVREAQALVSQYQTQLNEINSTMAEIGVNRTFDAILPSVAKVDLSTAAVTKATKAVKDNTAAQDEAKRVADQLAQSRSDALRTMEDWTAQLAGPAAEAQLRYSRMEDELNVKLGDGALSLREYGDALAMIQTMRERDPALMSAQAQAAEKHAEQMKRRAQDIQDTFVGAAMSSARAFGDFFARGLKGGKDFAKSLKDIFKRMLSDVVTMMLDNSFVRPFQGWLQGMLSGAGKMQQQSGTSATGEIFSAGMDKLTGFFGKLFGRGGAAASAMEAGASSGMSGAFAELQSAGGLFASAGRPAGAVLLPNGQVAGSSFAGINPWLGAAGGAMAGYSMGGDTPGKIAGGLAGGVAGYGLAVGGSAAMAASAAGAGLAGSAAAGLAAIPVVGWIALAAFAVNAISGGKLFGTKYKTDSAAQQIQIGQDGASGFTSVSESAQKSFFRGKKYRTTTTALDAEGQKAVQDLFDALSKTVTQASQALGVDIPDLVGGTFRREFDAKGNLTKEFGTIAGRVYAEGQEAFASRLVGENLLNVAKQAGSSAELEMLADAYRSTGEELQSFAALALAVQSDLKNANGIWKEAGGDDVMTRIVGYIEGIAKAGENMAETYARVSQAIAQYGDLIGGVRQQIATRGLNQYQKAQLDVELAYRAQVKQANELAKALGLTGARSEDLASIEQLRALNMADLATQYAAQQKAQTQTWLEDLGLSDLSPMRDDQKLAKSMELLGAAVANNDAQRAQKLADMALGFGRNLYASGHDYNALYAQVTGLIGDMQPETLEGLVGLTNDQLGTLADMVDGLPSRIAQELAKVLVPTPPPATVDPALPPTPVPNPGPSLPDGGGGGGGGGDFSNDIGALVPIMSTLTDINRRMLDIEEGRQLDAMSNGTRSGGMSSNGRLVPY